MNIVAADDGDAGRDIFRPVSGSRDNCEPGDDGQIAKRVLELVKFLAELGTAGVNCLVKTRQGKAGSSHEVLYAARPCHRRWLCPRCGYAAARDQARKVERRLRSWTAQGGAVALLTLTQSHCRTDGLATLWHRADRGWDGMVTGSTWRACKQKYGLRGYFRSTELVYNSLAGWNVHFHAILLLNSALDESQLRELRMLISRRFARGVNLAGGLAAEHLQDLRPMTPGSEKRLAAYCLKGNRLQPSVEGSLTPMGILDHFESTGEGVALWEEYASAVNGKKRRTQFIASRRIDELRPPGLNLVY